MRKEEEEKEINEIQEFDGVGHVFASRKKNKQKRKKRIAATIDPSSLISSLLMVRGDMVSMTRTVLSGIALCINNSIIYTTNVIQPAGDHLLTVVKLPCIIRCRDLTTVYAASYK